MRIHQLNCGTLLPVGGPIPCRVLLVEAPGGLVLVDTGLGLRDVADPAGRIGPLRHLIRPAFDARETAARRIEALGFSRDDVRHIVVTHLDNDHVGGLADFPDAEVHVAENALTWAVRTPKFVERRRYRRVQWSHGPRWVEHRYRDERWEGFRLVPLDAVAEGMMLVDLPGHTQGHAGVFVPGGVGTTVGGARDAEPDRRDVLHVGDAFYHRGQIDPAIPVPRHIPLQERLFALQPAAIELTHARLTALAERRRDTLDVVCAHDPSGPGGIAAGPGAAGEAPGGTGAAA